MVIVIGWGFINPANHTPFIPETTTYTTPEGVTHPYGGIMGILGAAGVVFFAFIGFDAVSTAAQEAKNPERDMPIGILGSLVICTMLYVLFSYVLSGVATVEDFRTAGKEASVTFAIAKYMIGYAWLAKFVTVAILAGFSSVILVMLLGQSRVFYSMSVDGLVPKVFSDVHPKFKTPWKSNMLFFGLTAIFGGFIPGDIVGEMTSIGTLFAFILVCAGVWIMRVRRPDLPRAFRVPAVPGGVDARHRRLRRDDLRSRMDELAAAHRLAGDRSRVLLLVRPLALDCWHARRSGVAHGTSHHRSIEVKFETAPELFGRRFASRMTQSAFGLPRRSRSTPRRDRALAPKLAAGSSRRAVDAHERRRRRLRIGGCARPHAGAARARRAHRQSDAVAGDVRLPAR